MIDSIKLLKFLKRGGEDWEALCGNLKEKGVEYCVVFPLFEIVLAFDPIEDFIMESYSDSNNNQIFDFVVKSKDEGSSLIIEAKSFKEKSLKVHENQITRYMKDNDRLPWGILTNGLTWNFYISKKYIEQKFNEGNSISYIKPTVLKIFSLELENEYFFDFFIRISPHDFTWCFKTKSAK